MPKASVRKANIPPSFLRLPVAIGDFASGITMETETSLVDAIDARVLAFPKNNHFLENERSRDQLPSNIPSIDERFSLNLPVRI